MGVLGGIESAHHPPIERRLQFPGLVSRQNLEIQAVPGHDLGLLPPFFQSGRRGVDTHQPPLLEVETQAFRGGQLPKQEQAGAPQVPQNGDGSFHGPPAARGGELQQPGKQLPVHPGSDQQGTVFLEHPLQGLADDSRRRDRHGMAGYDHAGVAVGAA